IPCKSGAKRWGIYQNDNPRSKLLIMKNIKQVCTLLFLLFSACLFGQGHVMEIKDLGFIPGNETLRVYAVYEDDTTLDLITVRNGVTRYQSSDPENDDMVTNN